MTDVDPPVAPDPPQGTGGRESGTPEVMELLFGRSPGGDALSSRRCMRAECEHTVGDHVAAPFGYRPCVIRECACHQLLEEQR